MRDPAVPPLDVATGFFVWGFEHHHVTEWDDETDGLCRAWPDSHTLFQVLGWSYSSKKKKQGYFVMCACCVHCLKIYLA